jgi:hypothetical protein
MINETPNQPAPELGEKAIKQLVLDHTLGLFDDPAADQRLRSAASRIAYHITRRLESAATPPAPDRPEGMVMIDAATLRHARYAVNEMAMIYPRDWAKIRGRIDDALGAAS